MLLTEDGDVEYTEWLFRTEESFSSIEVFVSVRLPHKHGFLNLQFYIITFLGPIVQ